jgi:hypothetical protein
MADVVENLEVPSGHVLRKVIRCARQGEIKSCRVVQWDDDEALFDGFRFGFYMSAETCPPGVTPNDIDELDKWDQVHHLIGQRREVPKGEDELKKDGEPDTKVEGWRYRNRDNNNSQTNMLRQIYVELRDLGPTDPEKVKHYKLILDIEPKTP